ncbi:MAG: FKBP-type peptidyl-prolyl cis-trans isomerase [Chitinophagaceae bacterium]
MKKWFFLLLASPIVFVACKKASNGACTYTESTLVAPPAEISYLDSALQHDGITAVALPSGVFYTIDSLGSGVKPGICSVLLCTYIGNVYGYAIPFDSYTDTSGTTLTLGSLVPGWQKAMQQVPAGSRVTLYIPPSLAYGDIDKKNNNGDIIIPGHSYLKFRIYFKSVY